MLRVTEIHGFFEKDGDLLVDVTATNGSYYSRFSLRRENSGWVSTEGAVVENTDFVDQKLGEAILADTETLEPLISQDEEDEWEEKTEPGYRKSLAPIIRKRDKTSTLTLDRSALDTLDSYADAASMTRGEYITWVLSNLDYLVGLDPLSRFVMSMEEDLAIDVGNLDYRPDVRSRELDEFAEKLSKWAPTMLTPQTLEDMYLGLGLAMAQASGKVH